MKTAEKAILVGVRFFKDIIPLEESIAELESLALTAGATVVETFLQSRDKPDGKYYIGTGKSQEILESVKAHKADIVIFDNELHASQIRNLEELLGVKVVDRTQLILDIFAQHANTAEGRLQVGLAQAEFSLTRLSGRGIAMSRLGGGIGTRGPGETKIEEDRRKIRKNVSMLKKELEGLRQDRHLRRSSRKASGIKAASIVGYTNSGKSSLLNALTKAGVLAENKLFATLDTTTRKLFLQDGGNILISDTVGFIQKLPHQLVDAFKATLDEVTESDILIHVTDASSPYMEDQITAVYQVLEEIKAISKPIITVFNKIDLVDEEYIKNKVMPVAEKFKPYVLVSSTNKTGLVELKEKMSTSFNG